MLKVNEDFRMTIFALIYSKMEIIIIQWMFRRRGTYAAQCFKLRP